MEQKKGGGKSRQQEDRGDSSRTKDMQKANENIRKSQGEDSAIGGRPDHKPAIDRDR